MANRIVLNPVSYHGVGAVKEIVTELTNRSPVKSKRSLTFWMLPVLSTLSTPTLNPIPPSRMSRTV